MDNTNNYFLKFPSWTLILLTTQRKAAGCISQYLTGLLDKLIALYKDFFIFGTVGQKSFTPTFVIELEWRKIICGSKRKKVHNQCKMKMFFL